MHHFDVLRPLHTLWSLVCAKGVVRGCPGKRCRHQRSPLGTSERKIRAGRTPATRGSTLIGKGLQTNYRSKIPGDGASQKMGRGWPCTFIKILPSKEVVIEQDQGGTLNELDR